MHDAIFTEAKIQLGEYFAGSLKSFSLPLDPSGTPFQLSVLNELKKIPYGETVSYGEIAARLNKPQAMRSVRQTAEIRSL